MTVAVTTKIFVSLLQPSPPCWCRVSLLAPSAWLVGAVAGGVVGALTWTAGVTTSASSTETAAVTETVSAQSQPLTSSSPHPS